MPVLGWACSKHSVLLWSDPSLHLVIPVWLLGHREVRNLVQDNTPTSDRDSEPRLHAGPVPYPQGRGPCSEGRAQASPEPTLVLSSGSKWHRWG